MRHYLNPFTGVPISHLSPNTSSEASISQNELLKIAIFKPLPSSSNSQDAPANISRLCKDKISASCASILTEHEKFYVSY